MRACRCLVDRGRVTGGFSVRIYERGLMNNLQNSDNFFLDFLPKNTYILLQKGTHMPKNNNSETSDHSALFLEICKKSCQGEAFIDIARSLGQPKDLVVQIVTSQEGQAHIEHLNKNKNNKSEIVRQQFFGMAPDFIDNFKKFLDGSKGTSAEQLRALIFFGNKFVSDPSRDSATIPALYEKEAIEELFSNHKKELSSKSRKTSSISRGEQKKREK